MARTDPEAVKHAGLTSFVVDMHRPGVEVRPLRQMTGEAEFNEVYFTDTRIPDGERLGEVGEGWRVSLTTLMNERVRSAGRSPARVGRHRALVKAFKSSPPERRDAELDEVMKAVDPRRGAAADEHPGQPEPQDG